MISTKDNLKALETINATVYNKNGAFNLQGLSVNASQSVSNFTKLNNAFTAYNGNLSKSTQLQNAYIQAVGKQNVSLGNYLAGLNGAKASMGGYIKSLIGAKAASIGLQAASLALNAAISMGLSLAISALVSAITKWVNKEKEAREEAIENAKAAKEESNNLSELLNKYNQLSREVKSNQGVKEDLLDVQSDLLEALGIEASQIDTLIEKYGDLDTAINQVTLDSLREAQGDLMTAVDAYEGDLIDVGKGYAWYSMFDRNILSGGQDSVKAFDILEKAGVISSGSHGTGGGSLVLTGNDKTVEGILENYQKLKDAQEALNTAIDNGEVTMEEMTANPLYQAINERLDELDESIGNYNTAVDDLNKNIAQQQILKSLSEQSSIPETQEEFEAFKQSMIDTAVASTKFVGSQDDIRDSIINVLSTMPEFEKFFDEIKVKSETFKTDTSFSLTEAQSQSIDDFQSKVKTLSDALSSIQSGSMESGALTDLIREFPELQDKSENLEQAIIDLIYNALNELYATLGEGLPDNIKEDLQSIADTASGLTPSLKASFSEIQKSYNALNDFKNAFDNNNLTDSELSSIASLSSNLETLVAGFYAGVVSADELYAALTEHYDTDLENYGKALIAKNELNQQFYEAVGLTSADAVNQFSEDYGIDIENCKNYNDARMEIEKQTLLTVSEMWREYYNAQSKTFTDKYRDLEAATQQMINNGALSSDNGTAKANQEFLQNLRKQAARYENASDALNNIVYHGIASNFQSTLNGLNASGSTKELTKEMNWLERLIHKAATALDKLKNKVSNTYISWTIRNHNLSQAIHKTNEVIQTQQAAYEKYMQKANSVGLSQSYVNKIQNGTLDMETITDESLSNMIEEYQTWYDKATECTDAIEDLKTQLAELAKQKFDHISTYFDSLMQTTQASISRLEIREGNSYQITDPQVYSALYAETQNLIAYNKDDNNSCLNKISLHRKSNLKLTRLLFVYKEILYTGD